MVFFGLPQASWRLFFPCTRRCLACECLDYRKQKCKKIASQQYLNPELNPALIPRFEAASAAWASMAGDGGGVREGGGRRGEREVLRSTMPVSFVYGRSVPKL